MAFRTLDVSNPAINWVRPTQFWCVITIHQEVCACRIASLRDIQRLIYTNLVNTHAHIQLLNKYTVSSASRAKTLASVFVV